MKTLADLMNLITEETRMNEGKICKYVFDISTQYHWCSMKEIADLPECSDDEKKPRKVRDIFTHESIATSAEIQKVFWLIWTNGRHDHLEIKENENLWR